MKVPVSCILIMGIVLPFMLFAQTENWVYRLSSRANGKVQSIVCGADGNIYAAGSAQAAFAIVSLTPAGETNWVYLYSGSGLSAYNSAYAIAYGADGNIYAAGNCLGSDADQDITVLSLTTAGVLNWDYQYNGSASENDWGASIVYGADGNIYAAGMSRNTNSEEDMTIISLNAGGGVNWIYDYSSNDNGYEVAKSIAYGADGNIYAGGMSTTNPFFTDMTVISLASTGDTNWIYNFSDSTGYDCNYAAAVVYGTDNNIHITGTCVSNPGVSNIIVLSLSTSGDTNWVYRYSGPPYLNWDEATDMVIGDDDNIYVVGRSLGMATSSDFVVVSLTTAGDSNWVYRYDGPANSGDEARSVVFGNDGNIYVAGVSTDITRDIVVISLTPTGTANWVYRYDGPYQYNDQAYAIARGVGDTVYVAGYSTGLDAFYDFTVISLSPDLSVQEDATPTGSRIKTSTVFRGPLILPKDKSCKVFDISGREVKPHLLAPGIYFIEVDGKIAQKVIKVK